MKRKLLVSAMGLLLLAFSVQGQLPKYARDGSKVSDQQTISPKLTAPDFTVTFTDGSTGNLYSTLNAGNSVFLDQFFTT